MGFHECIKIFTCCQLVSCDNEFLELLLFSCSCSCWALFLKHILIPICTSSVIRVCVSSCWNTVCFVWLGNCQGASTATHKIYSKCISILVGGTDCECSNSLPLELDTIGKELKEVKGNVLAAEQAEVLYHLCWLSLKALNSKNTRYWLSSLLQAALGGLFFI